MSSKFAKEIRKMSASERVELAKSKIQRMVDALIQLIAIHENNALITYSPLLSVQIPKSHAANAFNVVQESIHFYEIVRLCTFWDGLDHDKSNIPTVVELVNNDEICKKVFDETKAHWTNIGTSHVDPDSDAATRAQVEKLVRASNEDFGHSEAEMAIERLRSSIKSARWTKHSRKLTNVMNMRDKHLAHQLEKTRAEGKGTVKPMKYGDEKDLLEKTIQVVGGLHLSINGADFDFSESTKIAQKRANALWSSCKFTDLE